MVSFLTEKNGNASGICTKINLTRTTAFSILMDTHLSYDLALEVKSGVGAVELAGLIKCVLIDIQIRGQLLMDTGGRHRAGAKKPLNQPPDSPIRHHPPPFHVAAEGFNLVFDVFQEGQVSGLCRGKVFVFGYGISC